jgi:hypothetical protein
LLIRLMSPHSAIWLLSWFHALDHSKNIQGPFKEYSRTIQGTFKEHSRTIQGTFKEHSRTIQGLVAPAHVSPQCDLIAFLIPRPRPFKEHSRNIQGTF